MTLVPAACLAEIDVSTHAISLAVVAEAIGRLAIEVTGQDMAFALLAAQTASLDEADRLTPEAEAAVALAVEGLRAYAARQGE